MNTGVRVLGRLVGGVGMLAVALVVVVGILFLALSSVYRATCGDDDSGRPQYFVVLPWEDVPSNCRGARTGYRILIDGVTRG